MQAVVLAGLTPVAVDLIPFALTRLNPGSRTAGNLAYVDVGAHTTTVTVMTDSAARFVRILASGGHDVTAALADRLEVTSDEADRLKRSLALVPATGSGSEKSVEVEIVREVTNDLLANLRNTLNYFSNTRQNQLFTGIVLTGGGARLSGFAEALSEFTHIPVSSPDPFDHVDISRNLEKKDVAGQHAMTVALGLAMGSAA